MMVPLLLSVAVLTAFDTKFTRLQQFRAKKWP